MHHRLAADLQRLGQHCGGEGEDIGAARCLALIVGEPLRPGLPRSVADLLNGAGAIRHRLRGIGDVLGEGASRGRRLEAQLVARLQVQRLRRVCAAALATQRPAVEAPPLIGAGLKRGHRGHIRGGRAVLQVLRQERPQHVFAKPGGGVAAEAQMLPRLLPSSMAWP